MHVRAMRRASIGVLLCVLGGGAGVGAQVPQPAGRADTMPAPMLGTPQDALRPGDLVRLKIWREPDLSGDFAVDETGTAVLPKLGRFHVTQYLPAALRDTLVAAYAAFLTHRSIEVTLLRRVQVLGAVRQPGVYPVDPTMTISDVLAVAGGTTTEGDPNNLELIRAGKKIPGMISRQSLVGESHVRSGDQIFVPERSWLSRNFGVAVITILTATMGVAATLAAHR